ncbi:MAG: DUF4465 domain-containing protein [Prevotella sp.]|nr:DUF4465 domain-containing protein [Prevotella sp.]
MKKISLACFLLVSAGAVAQNPFVIETNDGKQTEMADKTPFIQSAGEWSVAGISVADIKSVSRNKNNINSYSTVTFEACTFEQGKHNNLKAGKAVTYAEEGLIFNNQEKYSMFSGVLVSDQSEVSKWQSSYPGTLADDKVIATNAQTPAGANLSAKYAIIRADTYMQKYAKGPEAGFSFADNAEHQLESAMFNNTANTWQQCKIGYYSKPGLKDGDYFEVILTGYDLNGDVTGKVSVILADYRNGKEYICNEWTKISLATLGKVAKVIATSESSEGFKELFDDNFGFCIDNIAIKQ